MGAVGGGVRGLQSDHRGSIVFSSLKTIMIHLVSADLVEVVSGPGPAPAPGAGVVCPQVVAGEGGVEHLVGQVIKENI